MQVNVWLHELVKFTALSFLIQKYIRFFQLYRYYSARIISYFIRMPHKQTKKDKTFWQVLSEAQKLLFVVYFSRN